ncbi:hypothetical protein [Deinococcus koreensis]|uniref:Uncharacterized protein n=1 Tax=Deinococcus koreensis TaxID=2054903 RepID=A0A2K3UT87_9DEIO|nr:hypothetical protein [Deinococcus koreensis]PNY79746.1 hypothetical protein CVO96_17490 [Deinococcus koreensis]
MIRIDGEGRLHGAPDVLALLLGQTFRVTIQGDRITLRLVPRRLSEIDDPEERAKAVDAFLSLLPKSDGPAWPADYNVRDDIYD